MTKFYIEGVEVTDEHVGEKLEVVEEIHQRWLPKGFVSGILDFTGTEVEILDNDSSWLAEQEDLDKVRWVNRSIVDGENKGDSVTSPPKAQLPPEGTVIKIDSDEEYLAVIKMLQALDQPIYKPSEQGEGLDGWEGLQVNVGVWARSNILKNIVTIPQLATLLFPKEKTEKDIKLEALDKEKKELENKLEELHKQQEELEQQRKLIEQEEV